MTNRPARTTVLAAAVALSLSLAASACGDDDGDDAASYVNDGNALCDRTADEIEAALPDFESEPTTDQVMELADDLAPVLTRWRAGVADLDPPSDLEDEHARLLDALETSIDQTEAAASSEAGAQALLEAGGPPLDEPASAAHALFDRCPAGD